MTGAAVMGLAAAPAAAAVQNWTQLNYSFPNEAGVSYEAVTDSFEIWDNNRDNLQVYAQWNYKGISDSWTTYWVPADYPYSYTVDRDLTEGRVIYLRVCKSVPNAADPCSTTVETGT
ncbi:hypothetical protein GCM10020367_24680 [Streptomyces sannanensis]|uniref:Uncharacterized protein n=2 Tax=Streptomyces sannanensis TaxID=285536 RepID=A0ABP6SAJ4_9ACTN